MSDTRPDFDFRDLVCVRAMLTLVDSGISARRIRNAVAVLQETVPDLADPLAALRLWAEGSERIVVHHQGVLVEPEGQMVLDFATSKDKKLEPAQIAEAGDPQEELKQGLTELFQLGCTLDSDPDTYQDAIEAYEFCIEIDESFADAHCNLGAVYYNIGRRDPARRCFERCLEIEPRHVEAHFNLANILEEAGCNEMALSHYRAALRADPFYADLHVNMALLYERMSQPKQVREHWRRYLQLHPSGAWSEVARQRLGLGDGEDGAE